MTHRCFTVIEEVTTEGNYVKLTGGLYKATVEERSNKYYVYLKTKAITLDLQVYIQVYKQVYIQVNPNKEKPSKRKENILTYT